MEKKLNARRMFTYYADISPCSAALFSTILWSLDWLYLCCESSVMPRIKSLSLRIWEVRCNYIYTIFTYFLETSKNRKQESVRGILFWTFINVHFQNLKDFLITEKCEKSILLDNAVNSEKIIFTWLHNFFQEISENQTRYKIYRNLPSFSDFFIPFLDSLLSNIAS